MKNTSTQINKSQRLWWFIVILVVGVALSFWLYAANQDFTPPIVLFIGGSVISFLLAFLFYLFPRQTTVLGTTQNRWKLALEAGEIGVWDLDVVKGTAFLSKEWKLQIGYLEDEIDNKHEVWVSRLHPDDKEKALTALDQYINNLTDNYELEFRLRCKDGSYKWILSQGMAVERDTNHKATHIIGVHVDITTRKEAQLKIHTLAMIANLTRNSVILTDPQGKIEWVNQAFYEITGYTLNEIKGKKPGEFLQGAQTDKKTVSKMHECLSKNEGFTTEICNYTKNGTPIWLEIEVKPIFDDNGKLIQFMGVETNITEKKEIESMRSEFVSMVSHELRTPLTSIRASLGLVSQSELAKLSEKSKVVLQIAQSNCERLERLISDILDVDKMEAGLLKFKINRFDLTDAIKTSIANNKGFADSFNITIVPVGLDTPCEIEGDQDRILQVMDNLISNGCKYSQPGEELVIRLIRHDNTVRVEVEDYGKGIPQELQELVFAKFMQVDSSDRREKGGSGLGLHLAKIIIKKHLGHIGFNTSIGKGTCFYFEIPLTQKHSYGE